MGNIKISELSIGDWVKCLGEPMQVYWIEGDSVGMGVADVLYYSCNVAEVKPIPLTPDILERNGWNRKNNYGWYLFYDKYIRINIWFDKDRWDVEISSEDRRVTYADITGRGTLHIHQLQHALRLAGVEKEIVL